MNIRTRPFEPYDLISYLLIILLPFALVAIGDDWVFPLPTGVDPWVYSGLQLHLPEFLRVFGRTYYAARVPWIVPGWLVHSVFDDATALYVLHFALFYLGVFSLYVSVRVIFANRTAAFATALLLGVNSFFLFAIGWDYVDGPSIVCMLAAFAAMAGACIRLHWRLASFIWGVAICAMVSLYILLVLLVPVQIGMFLILNRIHRRRPAFSLAMYAAVGGVVSLLSFCLMNWLLGGQFLYFMAQIDALIPVAGNRAIWYLPFADWIWSAPWLLVPAVILAFSAVVLWFYSRSVFTRAREGGPGTDSRQVLLVCCLGYISAALIFAGLEAFHFSVLQMAHYADELLPFGYLVIGGLLAVIIKLPDRAHTALLIVITALVLMPVIFGVLGYAFPEELFKGASHEIAWVAAAAILSLLAIRWRLPLTNAVLVIVLVSVVDTAFSRERTYPHNPVLKSATLAVFDASRAAARYDRGTTARFWFNKDDPNGAVLRDVTSTYLYDYRLVNEDFPNLVAPDGTKSQILPGERIILLASAGDPVSAANAAFANENISFEPVAIIPIRRPGVAFELAVTDVKLRNPR